MTGRIAVGVSGTGTNLRALATAIARGALDAEIALVFADRACLALEWAAEEGIETAFVPPAVRGDEKGRRAEDETLAATLSAIAPDLILLAGYLRILGPATLAAFEGRILNTHPALLPAFPGLHPVRDALRAGVAITGVTVHVVDGTLDGGPILAQEAVPVLPRDDETTLHERIKAVEHRLLPATVGLVLAGALRPGDGSGAPLIDAARADASVPMPRRALLATSDRTGLESFAAELVQLGFELVATGRTAAALRSAGLPVTDVAAVTGVAEMLDGRVKTLHPRIHGGILADRRRPEHRQQLIEAGIAPFELVVVNLYPFEAAAERHGISVDALIEEIDIGGPALIRAAAKNHGSVAVVTSPDHYPAILAALRVRGEVPLEMRAALAIEAFGRTAAYDARITAELPGRMADAGIGLPDEPGLPGASDPFPQRLTIAFEKVERLRYGENPHQPAARYRRPGAGDRGLFGGAAGDGHQIQGKSLSYTNVLDAAAAATLAGSLSGAACVIVKHTNPCGAAVRPTIHEAWRDALAGDPVSAFGGVVAVTRAVDRRLAELLAVIFLEIVVAPAFDDSALEILAAKPNLRLLVDPGLDDGGARTSPDPLGSIRTAGGAVLVTAADTVPDDPSTWTVSSARAPLEREWRDLELAWSLVRGVTSNAIVLVRDGMQIGLGSGQTSRVDAARQAIEKARSILGSEVIAGSACASDAFFPFADGPQACLDAGVSAFVQPGGSVRDAEVIAAVNAAGAAMLFTGVRHFRH